MAKIKNNLRKYPNHYAPKPNEWVPHSAKMEWQCCDCGLVHNVWFRISKTGQLEVKMTRNKKETLIQQKLKLKKNENKNSI